MTQCETIDQGARGGRHLPGSSLYRAAGRLTVAAVLLLPLFDVAPGLASEHSRQGLTDMPMVWTSLAVSRRADRIATTAPGLLSVTSSSEQNRLRGAVQADIAQLEADLRDLRRQGTALGGDVAGQAAAMAQLVGQFSESLEVLDRTASARLAIHYLKSAQREAVSTARQTIVATLKPWASETAATTAALSGALREAALDDRGRVKIGDALIEALILQRRIERTIESSERAELALAVAACCAPQDRLPDIRVMIETAVRDLEGLAPVMAEAGLPSLARPVAVLRRAGFGPQNIVSLRQVELRMLTVAEAALARSAELAEAFSGRVDSLVASARETQSAAN